MARIQTKKDGEEVAPPLPGTAPAATPALVGLETADTQLDGILQKVRANGGQLPQGADVALKTLAGVLLTLAGGGPAGDDGALPPGIEGAEKMTTTPTTKRMITRKQFLAWGIAQMQRAAGEPREEMAKRLMHVQKVAVQIRKFSFEQTGAETKPLEVEMLTAYAGDGLPGTAEDLTTKSDQDFKQAAPGSVDTNTGDSQDSAMAQNAGEVIGKAVSSLLRELGYGDDGVPGIPSAARTDGATALSKGDGFVWPTDLNGVVDTDDVPVLVAKRAASDDLDFGADPGTPDGHRFQI